MENFLSDYDINLFRDKNLDFYTTKANNGFVTDTILSKTKFRGIKILIMRILRVHTRLQIDFNQNIISSINIIINKLSSFIDQISQDFKRMAGNILVINW